MSRLSRSLAGFFIIVSLLGFATWKLLFERKPQGLTQATTCPAIRDVSLKPLGEISFNGTQEKIKTEGFTDHFLNDKEGVVRVGLREEWGGSLVFFGDNRAGHGNTLDDSAMGRGLRLAFHDDARPRQGCSFNRSCAENDSCPKGREFTGWNPLQSGNKCGMGSGLIEISNNNGLSALFIPMQSNPGWNRKDCADTATVCADESAATARASLRVSQNVRFVKSGILEIEVLVTNLGDQDIVSKNGERHEFPTLFASSGKRGAQMLEALKNADGELLKADRRVPAAISNEYMFQELSAPEGWATYQNADSSYGVGIYWENRSTTLRAEQNKGDYSNLSSNFPIVLTARESIRGRYYLLLGGFEQIKELATDLDTHLPPFGRIDTNQILEDARTVQLQGWVLDNKNVSALELWVDGKKTADLQLKSQRDDVCATYPGYSMCTQSHARIGFETTYKRPAGSGCERPVEIRARDNDGNWRVIARKSISPVIYE